MIEQYTEILKYVYIAGWVVSMIASIFNMMVMTVYMVLLLRVVIPTYTALRGAAELYVAQGDE